MRQELRHVENRPFERAERPYLAASLDDLECLGADCQPSGWYVSESDDAEIYVSGSDRMVYIFPKKEGVDLHSIPRAFGMALKSEGSISTWYGNGELTGESAERMINTILGSEPDQIEVNGNLVDRLDPKEVYDGREIIAQHNAGMRVSIQKNGSVPYHPTYKVELYNITGAGQDFEALKKDIPDLL